MGWSKSGRDTLIDIRTSETPVSLIVYDDTP